MYPRLRFHCGDEAEIVGILSTHERVRDNLNLDLRGFIHFDLADGIVIVQRIRYNFIPILVIDVHIDVFRIFTALGHEVIVAGVKLEEITHGIIFVETVNVGVKDLVSLIVSVIHPVIELIICITATAGVRWQGCNQKGGDDHSNRVRFFHRLSLLLMEFCLIYNFLRFRIEQLRHAVCRNGC